MNAKKTKKTKRSKAVLAVLLTVVIAVLGTMGFLALQLLGKLQTNPADIPSNLHGLEDGPEDPVSFETVYDITDASSLNNFLFQWWYNGGDDMIRYSRDVVNVLLVGVDDNDGQPGAGRSDTMMLASVNKKTRTITLLSFLRDSYCYFDVNGEAHYHRLNSSYYYGGPAGLMEAISRLYKIKVDKYITVDFKSFPKLVDALGGVTVEVSESEARYLNRNATSVKRTLEAGSLHLNGKEALAFSRIRKLDSDMARVNRQQMVIESILERARGANLVQLYNALDTTLPYVHTNYSRGELLGMIPSAMGWLDFKVVHMGSPILEGEESNAIGGTVHGMSILIVDYPKAAQQVQMALYGQSNIDLQDDDVRSAYIESIFAEAAQRQPSGGSSGGGNYPSSTQPWGEDGEEDYTGEYTTEPTTGGGGQPNWPFWPWGGVSEETVPVTETVPEGDFSGGEAGQ